MLEKPRKEQVARPEPTADPQEKPGPTVPTPEFGGPHGLEPTRYGDWERGGRCIDF